MHSEFFPEFVRELPAANIPIDGLRSWLFQGENQLFVFMEFSQNADVPAHSHEAQWGVVLNGQMDLTIEGKTRTLKKGDCYWLEAEQVHSAMIYAGYKDLKLFNQKDRYKTKAPNSP